MDPSYLVAVTGSFVGACVAQKCADAAIEAAWQKIKAAIFAAFGREPRPADVRDDDAWADPALLDDAQRLFDSISALRRARLVAPLLSGVRVLWVDDRPGNNAWERAMFGGFGVEFSIAISTMDAVAALGLQHVDLVISDIDREGCPDEGIRALGPFRTKAPLTPVIFYTGSVRRDLPVPVGAFGIADRPDDLLHLVLDVVERARV